MTKTSHSYSIIFAGIGAYLQLDAVVSSEIPQFPRNRYTSWDQLDWLTKSDAKFLFYTEDTWNNFLTSPLERMSYERVAQFLGLNNAQYISQWQRTNIALQNIAIDSRTWDCWINHYTGNDWVDLRDKHNVSWAFEALGWNESTWKSQNPEDWPETESKVFEELTSEEVLAAERICCGPEIWNGNPLTEWEYDANGISAVELNFQRNYFRPQTTTTSPSPSPSSSISTSPSSTPSYRPTLFSTLSQAAVKEAEEISDPTQVPTEYVRFTEEPSTSPSSTPSKSRSPSGVPTDQPSLKPSVSPSYQPSESITPSSTPTNSPTISAVPSNRPSKKPSYQPTGSIFPSSTPTNSPTISAVPSNRPSKKPSYQPTGSIFPSSTPTNSPTISAVPSTAPSKKPSHQPSGSYFPSLAPTHSPTASAVPSAVPSDRPSSVPSVSPSATPSSGPSKRSTVTPSSLPSDGPSLEPSFEPTFSPSVKPSRFPSTAPSNIPSFFPTPLECPANFTLALFTDKYPKETTWNLAMISSGKLVAEGFGYKNDFEYHEETMCIKFDTCYMFEIRDKWDDGICCENGQGSYAGFIEYSNSFEEPLPIPGLNGGAFETIQKHKFCLDVAGNLVEEDGLGNAIGVRFNGRHGAT